MKQFIVFAYDNYYPGGGCTDIKDSFDTFTEAVAYINADLRDPDEPARGKNYDFYEVLDKDTGQVTTF